MRIAALLGLLAVAAAIVVVAAGVSARALDGGTIVNSGSTNSAAFQLDVRSDGSTTFTVQGRAPETRAIPPKSAALFLGNLRSALPLTPTKAEGCMKSASFGSSTFVIYHGHRSGDISCGQTLRDRTLMSDVNRIALEAKIPTLIPRTQAPTAPDTPEPSPTAS